jgi:hypothetical protein
MDIMDDGGAYTHCKQCRNGELGCATMNLRPNMAKTMAAYRLH